MKNNNSSGASGNSRRYSKRAVSAAGRPVCSLKRREMAVQLVNIKDGLVREFGAAIGGHGQLLRSALNEAEAIAWQTPYPHLLFPVLAQEKALAVNLWAARQRSVRRASREMALAE